MTALDLDFVRKAARKSAAAGPARSLDKMTMVHLARRTVIFTVDAAGIASLMDAAREDIPGLTTNRIVQTVANHNPDTFWAIARRDQFDIAAPKGEGFLAVLPLTHEGTRRLIDGSLDTRNPDLGCVARQSERPAGIYVWAIHAKGAIVAAIPLVLQKFSTPLYQGINIYSRPITKEGLRVLEPLGFTPGARYDGLFAPHLQMLDRSHEMPAVKKQQRSSASVSVRVVRSMDEMTRVIAIRSAVYMGEQHCPYGEKFDGNDHSASHVMLYVDGEPAACMRIRWFGGFAKFERAAILKRYRSPGLFLPFTDWAKEFARRKGYSKAYLHSQHRLWKIIERGGFKKVDDKIFHFSDHRYGAFACDLEVGEDCPTIFTEPMILNRPEDRLDRPGVLEMSMERGASNPHAAWTERRVN